MGAKVMLRCRRCATLRAVRSAAFVGVAIPAGFVPQVKGQAPLSIQQLLVQSQRWQFAAAIDHRGHTAALLDERWEQALSTSLRYGLTPRIELNASYRRALGRYRGLAAAGDPATSRSRQDSLVIGANWLARSEDRWPALILESRVTALAAEAGGERTLPGLSIAATLYRSIDPVVLSLRLGATRRRDFELDGARIVPGGSWRIEPLVNFAVNPRVTLIGGFTFARHDTPRVDARRSFAPRYELGMRAGIGFAPTSASTLFLLGDTGGTGKAGSLSLRWFYEF